MKRFIVCIAAALSLSLPGCAGSGSGTAPTACTQTPPPPYPALLYPQNSATGVPAPSTTVVLAFTGDPSAYGSPIVDGSTGVTVSPLQPPPNPLPSPMASQPPGTTLMSVSVGGLAGQTTYRVDYTSNAICIPPGSGSLALHILGSFTTK